MSFNSKYFTLRISLLRWWGSPQTSGNLLIVTLQLKMQLQDSMTTQEGMETLKSTCGCTSPLKNGKNVEIYTQIQEQIYICKLTFVNCAQYITKLPDCPKNCKTFNCSNGENNNEHILIIFFIFQLQITVYQALNSSLIYLSVLLYLFIMNSNHIHAMVRAVNVQAQILKKQKKEPNL